MSSEEHIDVVSVVIALDEAPGNDLARILILLKAFSGREGAAPIAGLTKLAKLDFLLRYPTYLAAALEATGRDGTRVKVADHERTSVESSMVRYRYGPWDFRYRELVDQLTARRLTWVRIDGRTVNVGLTPTGLDLAKELSQDEIFEEIDRRARLLPGPFRQMGANRLMKFIYETFPEITALRFGESIKP